MFYSVDLLRIRKNKKKRLPACWLAATIKDFVGTGFHKLSKLDVARVNIEDVCNDILDGINWTVVIRNETTNHFSLYLSSQLTFGALKIFQKQLIYLEDQCQQLYKNIITNSMVSKEKNSRKTVDNNLNLLRDNEVEALDLICLFTENEIDNNLIQDDIPMHLETGLEFHNIDNNVDDIRRLPSNPLLHEDPFFNNLQDVLNMTDYINAQEQQKTDFSVQNLLKTPLTPKRKFEEHCNETPTKRSKKSLASLSNTSELAGSPVTSVGARRSIFNNEQIPLINADSATSGCIPMDEDTADTSSILEPGAIDQSRPTIRYGPSTRNGRMIEPTPPRSNTITEVSSTLQTNNKNVTVSINDKIHDIPQISQDSVLAITNVHPNIIFSLHTSSVQQTGPYDLSQNEILQRDIEDNLYLEELSEVDSSVSNLQNQTRQRNILVFDRVKQICLTKPETNWHHTRSLISTRSKLNKKVPAKYLLTFPCTGLKIRAHLNKNLCSWGETLTHLFFKNIQTPCSNEFEFNRDPQPRQANLNRSIRFSELRESSSSKPNESQHALSKSLINSIIEPNKEYESIDQDMILMPPPLTVPELLLDIQIEEQDERQQIPQFNSDLSDLQIVMSPQQIVQNTSNSQQVDIERLRVKESTSKRLLSTPLLESDDSFLPKTQRFDFINRFSSSSCSENESQTENLIISMTEFYDLLEDMWLIAANYLIHEEQLLVFKLYDILTPGDASIEELIKYFIYCFELEKQFKLFLKQEIAYGPVHVIKDNKNKRK